MKKEPSQKKRSRSRSPSPRRDRGSRGIQNVWSTNTEFQQYNHYSNRHSFKNKHQASLPSETQNHAQSHQNHKQYVQLTQEHYPLQEYREREPRHRQQDQKYENDYPPPVPVADDYGYYEDDNDHHHHHRYNSQNDKNTRLQKQHSQKFQAFMATSHATNAYTPSTQRKLQRSTCTTRYKDDITW